MSARTRIGIGWALGLLFAAQVSAADSPAPNKVYTSKQLFHVPIRMSDADRAAIRELKFYVKPPGGEWILQETGGPNTTKFDYHPFVDGEYLFNFITVDAKGRHSAGHPDQDPPKLIVVVDTQPPQFIIQPLTVASGQTYLQCTERDANPDMGSLSAEYEAEPGTWKPLIPLGRDMPGVYKCVDGHLPNRIRVSGKDKADNANSQIVALASTVAPAPVVAATSVPATDVVPQATAIVAAPPAPTAAASLQPAPLELPLPMPIAPLPVPAPVEPRVVEKPIAPLPAPFVPVSASATRQLLNSTRCNLAYGLDGLGTQTVLRVEAYATRDEGKTWQRLAEDSDRMSPIELTLPEDGLYGIAMVVTTAGQPGTPPAVGEQPDWWVEVDTTAPEIKLDSAVPGTGDETGLLLMNWTIRDRNLAPDSAEVSWSHQPEGPWQSIAKGLRCEGQYRWPVPREAGFRVYLKVEATDRAGNAGRFTTPQPVSVEANRPRARILGINPGAVLP